MPATQPGQEHQVGCCCMPSNSNKQSRLHMAWSHPACPALTDKAVHPHYPYTHIVVSHQICFRFLISFFLPTFHPNTHTTATKSTHLCELSAKAEVCDGNVLQHNAKVSSTHGQAVPHSTRHLQQQHHTPTPQAIFQSDKRVCWVIATGGAGR